MVFPHSSQDEERRLARAQRVRWGPLVTRPGSISLVGVSLSEDSSQLQLQLSVAVIRIRQYTYSYSGQRSKSSYAVLVTCITRLHGRIVHLLHLNAILGDASRARACEPRRLPQDLSTLLH